MLRDEGPGFPFFLPKGMTLKNTLLDYWRQVHKKYGYVEISTPIMLNRQLWERSGHWDHYKNNMYTTVTVSYTHLVPARRFFFRYRSMALLFVIITIRDLVSGQSIS